MTKVFLSHSSMDKGDVERLAKDLIKYEIDVFFDKNEIGVGDPIAKKIERGIKECDYLAIWITKSALESKWVEQEWQAKFYQEVNENRVRVLPLLAQDVVKPALLAHKLHADFRNSYEKGLIELLKVLAPDKINNIPTVWDYAGWLFNINGYRLPYVPLVHETEKSLPILEIDDLKILCDLEKFSLPKAFEHVIIGKKIKWNNDACRLNHYDFDAVEKKLSTTFSKTTYEDYLRSGEVLDFPVTNKSNMTFRQKFAPILINKERNLREFPLSNICGTGLFILTSDKVLIASKHSWESHVYPGRLTYSASGILLWGNYPDPFLRICARAYEELKHQVNIRKLKLIDFGVDARKLYYQFSFVEYSNRTYQDIKKDNKDIIPIQIEEPDSVIELILGQTWEPAAEATLLQFLNNSNKRIFEELKMRKDSWSEKSLKEEWDYRASLPGLLPDMSVRYPKGQLRSLSNNYINKVIEFIGNDIMDKSILEVGCGTGRITERIIDSVKNLTCIEHSEAMLRHHQERLNEKCKKIKYFENFAQKYDDKNKHDLVICSLVLIHNVDDESFNELINKISKVSKVVFIFEDVSKRINTGPHTKIRSREQIKESFSEFKVKREATYYLYKDEIAFIKFEK